MKTHFHILLTVHVSHSYYKGLCGDFDFVFPADTAQLMRNGRLIARRRENRLYLLFEADENGVALCSIAGKTLRLGLRLLNPNLSNFTDLDFDLHREIPLYQNETTPTAIDAFQPVIPVGPVFRHTLAAADRPLTVTLRNQGGAIVETTTLPALDPTLTISYDISKYSAGLYTVEEVGVATTSTAYYSDLEFQALGLFGVLEIKVDAGFYTIAPDFQIAFKARKETLKYYVTAKNYTHAEVQQLSVSDAGSNVGGRPKIAFQKAPAGVLAADSTAQALLAGDAGLAVALFQSKALVARQEIARRKIQLSRNSEVLIANLPQPGAGQPHSNLIVHVSKPKPS